MFSPYNPGPGRPASPQPYNPGPGRPLPKPLHDAYCNADGEFIPFRLGEVKPVPEIRRVLHHV
jgi:hypothetical protein